MEALRQIANPQYRAILFRRVFPSLEAADGMIQRSQDWYRAYGGRYNDSKHVWRFPSGARIYFGHMQREKDKLVYQGAQFSFIGFDELTEFTETQYKYLLTRNRAPLDSGLRVYARAASNPGNIGHAWVKRRFVTQGIVNRIRYFADIDGVDTPVEADEDYALSRAYYPAKLSDNPSIDPDYAHKIRATGDPVLIAQLLGGDWDAEDTGDRVYDNWSSEANVSTEAEYNPALPVYWFCDDGYVYGKGPGDASYHPRVFLLAQRNPLGGFNVFDEYYVTGETHGESIAAVKALDYRMPELAWVDGSAAMFRGELSKANIANANGTHAVQEGIKNMRTFICDGNGVRLLIAHPRCQQFIYEMGAYSNKPDARAKGGELEPIKIDDHGPDAARYGLWHARAR